MQNFAIQAQRISRVVKRNGADFDSVEVRFRQVG
jgi:hypothetical protein